MDSSPPEATAFAPTPATTLDELVKSAFFVADSIDAPAVVAISPTQVNLVYPEDGSLVSVRIEGRPGAWGGIGPLLATDEEKAAANKRYDDAKAVAQAPVEPLVEQPA